MMQQIVRGTTNDNTNPRVLFAWQSPNVGDSLETGVPPSKRQLKGGFFQPFSELSFEVLRPDGSTLVPSTVVDVALEANYRDPASDGGKQRLVILPFSVGAAEPVGTYTANVTFIVDPDDGPPIPVQDVHADRKRCGEDVEQHVIPPNLSPEGHEKPHVPHKGPHVPHHLAHQQHAHRRWRRRTSQSFTYHHAPEDNTKITKVTTMHINIQKAVCFL